jgi:predicted GH43/DUF377 family glycosyl hydrolase
MKLKPALALLALVILARTAVAQMVWIPYEHNPVIPSPEADEWPGLMRWVESVVLVDGTYHMFFTGTRVYFWVDHEIGHATSTDGITWTMDPNNPVMVPETEGDWDVSLFFGLAVIHDGIQFKMWYGGIDPGGWGAIGLANSEDGSSWTRHSGNPVFEHGAIGSFDAGLIFPGTVLRRGGRYQMWYSGSTEPSVYEPSTIGYAESPDGVSWTRHPGPVVDRGSETAWDRSQVYSPGVLFDGWLYHMWYTGNVVENGIFKSSEIGYATSPDGIVWTKDPDNPLDEIGTAKAQGRVLSHREKHECEMFYNGEAMFDFTVNRATTECRGRSARVRRVSGRRMVPVP